MTRKRILHVLGTADVAGSAICQYVQSLVAGLDPEEFQIEVCFLRPGAFVDRFAALGIKTLCADWNGSAADLGGAVRYAQELVRGRLDLIHQHTGGRFLTWMGRNLTSAKVILHVHGRSGDQAVAAPGEMRLPRRDVTIANSFVVAGACGDPDAVVIYPGVDVNRFQGGSRRQESIVVGTASRLEPVKGLSTLIEAVGIVARNRPEIRVEIAGDGRLRRELEQLTAQKGLRDNVSFLGWREDVPALLKSWEVFVLPSIDEGFGLAALEAMASGLPVIASDAGGLREIIQNGETGFLVPAGCSDALAEKLESLLASEELRARMGAAGAVRARESFSLPEMVRKSSALYRKVLLSS